MSTARAVSDGWAPNGDRAIIATRSYDVFTSHTPLVGQFSASSNLSGHVTHSLGPLLFWLLAIPSRLPDPRALAVTIGAFNAAAVLGVVWLARRHGGRAFMFVVALALVVMSRSLVSETYHDIWNPAAGVLPLTLLIFICWSLACGDHRLLPLGAFVASFAAQSQLAYVLPSLALLAVGTAGLAGSREWPGSWARAPQPPAGANPGKRPRIRRWFLAAFLVALVCWSGPIVDQIAHRPGNLVRVAEAATAHEPTLGASTGWRAVVRAVGIPPWWLRVPTGPFDRWRNLRDAPGAASVASCVLILSSLLIATFVGLRRGRRDVAAGGVIGLVLCAALAAVAASTPSRHSLATSLGYTMWWGSAAGMWAWLTLGLTLGASLRAGRRPSERARTCALAIGFGAVLVTAGAVSAAQRQDQDSSEYRPIRTVMAGITAALPPRAEAIRVAGSHTFTAFDFKAPIIYALRRRDLRVAAPAEATRLGPYYGRGRGYEGTVYVRDGPGPLTHGRLVARLRLNGAARKAITVTFSTPHHS